MAKTLEEQRAANRERARKRREAGLCSSCNDPAEDGLTTCRKHRQAVKVTAKRRYEGRKAARVCPLCRDPAKGVVEGKTCCRDCLNKQAAATAEHRDDYKERSDELKQQRKEERLAAGLCVVCGKRPAEDGLVSCRRCKAIVNNRSRRHAKKRRLAVITHYGAKCRCCGEQTFEFLEIDHVNNDGAAHRKEIGVGNLYKWLIANNYPPGFQVLCSSCNHAKGRYGVCPHQTGKAARRPDSTASSPLDLAAALFATFRNDEGQPCEVFQVERVRDRFFVRWRFDVDGEQRAGGIWLDEMPAGRLNPPALPRHTP